MKETGADTFATKMVPPAIQISYTEDELPKAAATLWQWGHSLAVWAFTGDLGAGKTALIRALCAHIGVTDAVSSPTFALIHEYRRPDGAPVYHMDWYRLRDADEAVDAGLEDALLTPGALALVEWPDRAPELLPAPHAWIAIETTGPGTRTLCATQHPL